MLLYLLLLTGCGGRRAVPRRSNGAAVAPRTGLRVGGDTEPHRHPNCRCPVRYSRKPLKQKTVSGLVANGVQLTILLAQLLLAKASGLALKAKPIPSI